MPEKERVKHFTKVLSSEGVCKRRRSCKMKAKEKHRKQYLSVLPGESDSWWDDIKSGNRSILEKYPHTQLISFFTGRPHFAFCLGSQQSLSRPQEDYQHSQATANPHLEGSPCTFLTPTKPIRRINNTWRCYEATELQVHFKSSWGYRDIRHPRPLSPTSALDEHCHWATNYRRQGRYWEGIITSILVFLFVAQSFPYFQS